MTALLSAERVSFLAGTATLVEDASLALEPGRMTVVVGPNGAGKSTLLKLLSGEARAASGRVTYRGVAVGDVPAWRLACLRAVLPQASRLAFPFTVAEVVGIGQDGIGRGLGRRERAAILDDALAGADVGHLAHRQYGTLSGGEQQRTQFARILAQLAAGRSVADRQVLLLDEPTASLDLKHQLALLQAARRLARDGTAVLAILHDLNLAAAFGDEVVAMSSGRIVAAGPPEAVIDDRLVAEVFEVRLKVGAVPAGRPFLLPDRDPD